MFFKTTKLFSKSKSSSQTYPFVPFFQKKKTNERNLLKVKIAQGADDLLIWLDTSGHRRMKHKCEK